MNEDIYRIYALQQEIATAKARRASLTKLIGHLEALLAVYQKPSGKILFFPSLDAYRVEITKDKE